VAVSGQQLLWGDNAMRCFAFHLMPWDRLPADFNEKYESAWTWLPNSIYEPRHGHELYNRYLDELVLADELGFDGVCVNEHHQNAYGTMPSPNLMGAILARQTKRAKIAVIGNALPLYNPPTRVAEEFAMIDVISGGRLIAGLVVGGGPEYYSFTVNPTNARAMFMEAMDLVLRAWSEPGPFEHYGEFWKLKYVNPWPRPIQQPHPTVWIPGAGSKETIDLVAARRFGYMGIPYFHMDFFRKNFASFRESCQQHGYRASPYQLGWLCPIYVAETDEQAWAEYGSHLFYFAHSLLKGLVVLPPGYTSPRSIAGINKALGQFLSTVKTREEIERGGYAIVGSAATVRDKLKDYAGTLGVGNLLGLFQLGTLPADLTQKSMRLFASEVMPALQAFEPDPTMPAGSELALPPRSPSATPA
jgi:alkanesulfonate monooxygenase SsuD/methylene tetrahydromethanopterin reductase-like flavin-dependent oxidoreductase (luciferase family)